MPPDSGRLQTVDKVGFCHCEPVSQHWCGNPLLLNIVDISTFLGYGFPRPVWGLVSEWQVFRFVYTLNQIEYFDFNLLEKRDQILNDKVSYFDGVHMSRAGGEAFTSTLAKIWMDYENGKEYGTLFYDNYSHVKRNSPYNHWIFLSA